MSYKRSFTCANLMIECLQNQCQHVKQSPQILCVLTNGTPTSIHLGIVWLTNGQRAQDEPPAKRQRAQRAQEEPWSTLDGEFEVHMYVCMLYICSC